MAFTIRRTTADDWEAVRALRLEALADTPIAFTERVADAEAVDEQGWRERAARGDLPHSVSLAAIDDDGTWLGTMRGQVVDGGPMLFGVYVSPLARGTGVADALLAGIEDWARTEGDALTLHVNEENPRARAFYTRAGYVPTGASVVSELFPPTRELEMVRPVR